MGAGHRVGAEDNVQALGGERHPEGLHRPHRAGLHRLEALFGVVPDAQVAVLVLEVVGEDEVGVRVVEGAVRGHEVERFLIEQRAVLDRGATRPRCPARALRPVGVDERPESTLGRRPAGGVEFFLGEGRAAPHPDALGSEDLDGVRPGVGQAVHFGGQFLGAPGAGGELAERGDDPGAGDRSARHRIAHRTIHRRTETLDGGEAGLEHPDAVFHRVQGRGLGRGAPRQLAVFAEVPVEVDMGVNQAGEDRAAGEVEALAGSGQIDNDGHRGDPSVPDHHPVALKHPTPPVEQPVSGDHQRPVSGRFGTRASTPSAGREGRGRSDEQTKGAKSRSSGHGGPGVYGSLERYPPASGSMELERIPDGAAPPHALATRDETGCPGPARAM